MDQYSFTIAMIYMGGTFGCTGHPLLPLPADVFLPRLQQLLQGDYPALQHVVASKQIRDSSQLAPQDWQDLLEQIQALVQQGLHRIVIVHGTDTLAYTAAFLAEFIPTVVARPVQVVVTGSQYPLLNDDGHAINPKSDALSNLTLAYQQLCNSSSLAHSNCWVTFDGHIWPAHTVQKIHTTSTPAFAGMSVPSRPVPEQRPLALAALSSLNIAVYYALPLSPAVMAQQLGQLLLAKPQAVIILAFGSGNLPRHAVIEGLLYQAQCDQIMMVLSTQVPFGGVNFNYAAGHWLAQFGVLSAGHLTLAAIYARLAWLMCQTLSFKQRQQYWQQCLR